MKHNRSDAYSVDSAIRPLTPTPINQTCDRILLSVSYPTFLALPYSARILRGYFIAQTGTRSTIIFFHYSPLCCQFLLTVSMWVLASYSMQGESMCSTLLCPKTYC
jgi:hypothetical protein